MSSAHDSTLDLPEDFIENIVTPETTLGAPIIVRRAKRAMPPKKGKKRLASGNLNLSVPPTPSKRSSSRILPPSLPPAEETPLEETDFDLINPESTDHEEIDGEPNEVQIFSPPEAIPSADALSQHSSRVILDLTESMTDHNQRVITEISDIKSMVDSLLKSHNALSTEVTRLASEIRAETRSIGHDKRGTNVTPASRVLARNPVNPSVAKPTPGVHQPTPNSDQEVSDLLVAPKPRYDPRFE
ncbi:hypothetical protein K3495_g11982 [Podosphaera aphanis]|nr:hypothetical protein K3495_g11982 [Podosphaera aphanis]